jgi:hypothetical protein
MEKKKYITPPEINVTVIESMAIMAGSLNPVNHQGNLGIGPGTETSGWASSKHYDVWADDEEQ